MDKLPRSAIMAAAFVVMSAARATAQVPSAADRQASTLPYDDGNRCFDRKDFACAVEKYQVAFTLFPSARTLLNLGLALMPMGRDEEAADAFSRYLVGDLPGFDKTQAKKVGKQLSRLGRKLGRLRVAIAEAGAEVRIDGRAVGATPLPHAVHLRSGTHRVVALKDGFFEEAQDVEVRARAEGQVTLTLRPQSRLVVSATEENASVMVDGALAGTTPFPGPIVVDPGSHRIEAQKEGFLSEAQVVEVAEGATVEVKLALQAMPPPPPPPPAPEPRITAAAPPPPAPKRFPWKWVAAGSAVVLGGASVAMGLSARSDYDDLAGRCGGSPSGCPQDDVDSVDRKVLITNVLAITAGAAAVTSAVLWWFDRPQSRTVATQTAHPAFAHEHE